MGIGTRMWIRVGLKQSKPLIIIKNRLFNVGGQIVREYDISEDEIMVLCKVCERYLDLLHGKPEESNSLASNERNNERKNERAIKKILEYLKDHTEITNVVGQEMTGKSTALVMLVLLKVTKEQKAICN